jgi:hypothetical protein
MTVQQCDLVLAFYPNARGFSYVVFEGPHSPVDWGMSDLPAKQKERRCLRRFETLMDQFRPDAVVLRRLPCRQRTTCVARAFQALEGLAKKRQVQAISISREKIRERFIFLDSTDRYAIAEVISRQIPPFAPYLPPKRKIWNGEDRRMGLFDAAALALTFFHNRSGCRAVSSC